MKVIDTPQGRRGDYQLSAQRRIVVVIGKPTLTETRGESSPVAGCLQQQAKTRIRVEDTPPLRQVRFGGRAAPRRFKDAADDYDDSPTGKRPGLPAAQAPGAVPVVRPELRQGPRLLPRGGCRALYGLPAARPGLGGSDPWQEPRQSFLLAQYVNDRPYTASSFVSVAISQVFGSALQGRCKDRPELTATAIPLMARIDVLPSGRRALPAGRV